MGAPTVGLEKLDSDQAEAALLATLEAYQAEQSTAAAPGNRASSGAGAVAHAAAPGAAGSAAAAAGAGLPKEGPGDRSPAVPLAAVMAGEVGGGNGIEPLVVGAQLGLRVVDGDLMGRAFPELQARLSRPWQHVSIGTDSGASAKGGRIWCTPGQEKVGERCRLPVAAALLCPALCLSVTRLGCARVPPCRSIRAPILWPLRPR